MTMGPHEDRLSDNVTYYRCDVSKWEEVKAVAERIQEEVGIFHLYSDDTF